MSQLNNNEYLNGLLSLRAPVQMETLRLGDFVRIIGGGCGYIEEFHEISAGAWMALVSFDYGEGVERYWQNCSDLRKVGL